MTGRRGKTPTTTEGEINRLKEASAAKLAVRKKAEELFVEGAPREIVWLVVLPMYKGMVQLSGCEARFYPNEDIAKESLTALVHDSYPTEQQYAVWQITSPNMKAIRGITQSGAPDAVWSVSPHGDVHVTKTKVGGEKDG